MKTMTDDQLNQVLEKWSTDPYRKVMAPGVGATTCGTIADAIRRRLSAFDYPIVSDRSSRS